jgi:uncharacterized protein (DUF3820 family)
MTRNELLKIQGINDEFQFGKYKGKTLFYVLDTNPQYIIWCINNIKEFKIDNRLKNDLLTHYNNWKVQRERKHMYNQMKQYNISASDYLSLSEAQEI